MNRREAFKTGAALATGLPHFMPRAFLSQEAQANQTNTNQTNTGVDNNLRCLSSGKNLRYLNPQHIVSVEPCECGGTNIKLVRGICHCNALPGEVMNFRYTESGVIWSLPFISVPHTDCPLIKPPFSFDFPYTHDYVVKLIATADTKYEMDFNTMPGDTIREKYYIIINKITEIVNVIVRKYGSGVFSILTCPEIAFIAETSYRFSPKTVPTSLLIGGIEYCGIVDGKYLLYIDPLLNPNHGEILVGTGTDLPPGACDVRRAFGVITLKNFVL